MTGLIVVLNLAFIKDKNKNKVTSELNCFDPFISNDFHSSKLLDDIHLKHELNNNEEIAIANNTKKIITKKNKNKKKKSDHRVVQK